MPRFYVSSLPFSADSHYFLYVFCCLRCYDFAIFSLHLSFSSFSPLSFFFRAVCASCVWTVTRQFVPRPCAQFAIFASARRASVMCGNLILICWLSGERLQCCWHFSHARHCLFLPLCLSAANIKDTNDLPVCCGVCVCVWTRGIGRTCVRLVVIFVFT